MPEPLEEAYRRRTPFYGGTPVKMADGCDWTIVKPVIRIVPTDDDIGYEVHIPGEFDTQFVDAMKAYDASGEDDGDTIQFVKAELKLALLALKANYELTTAEAAKLIQFSYNETADPEAGALRRAVMGAIFGTQAPKTLAVGDDIASSPTA